MMLVIITDKIAAKLHLVNWDWMAVSIAFLSLIVAGMALFVAIRTLRSQEQTQKNTKPIISISNQRILLEGILVHLFDGYMVFKAIRYLMETNDNCVYPAQDIPIEYKIPMDKIHEDLFYNNHVEYNLIHMLTDYTMVYNHRIDSFITYSSNSAIQKETILLCVDRILQRNIQLADCIIKSLIIIWRSDRNSIVSILDLSKLVFHKEKEDVCPISFEDNIYSKMFADEKQRSQFISEMKLYTTNKLHLLNKLMIAKS